MRQTLFCGVLLALASPGVQAQTIAPGTTSPPLQAEACFTAEATLCGIACTATCDLAENSAQPSLLLDNISLGNKWVVAAVQSDFTVKPSEDGSANAVDATISFDIEWNGLWQLTGVATGWNDAKARVTLTLKDLATGAVVRTVTVHEKDVEGFLDIEIIAVGAGRDRGSSVNSFSALLTRGRSYRLEMAARAEAKAALNAAISLDYQNFGGGVWWNDLRVTLAPDLAERIELLTRRVEALESHTHTYLTGKAEGHNNVQAETSTPIMIEAATAEERRLLPAEDAVAERLPANSVLPGGDALTLTYTLPEPLFVTVELFDSLGAPLRKVVAGERTAGTHVFDLSNLDLTSGVYFYRLAAGRFAETMKLTVSN
jgi:hypothetical protein